MITSTIVSKVWNYCNILRDDGVSYEDYVKQLLLKKYLMNQQQFMLCH